VWGGAKIKSVGGRKGIKERWRGWVLGVRGACTEEGRTSYQQRKIDMNIFQFFITCKRTNNTNNTTHYVELGKKR